LPPSAQRFQAALQSVGFNGEIVEVPQSTRTAAEAAQVVGCDVAQIVKSLIFRAAHSNRPILIIASGANRVDEQAVADLIGEPLAKADAAFVRERTGYAIGGVPPLGHAEPIQALVDEDLLAHAEIWAAAGTPNTLFRLTPAELLRLTDGRVVRIKNVASS
jgi:prolyl-tRNA editing enzyme YbaK/EbsC (Cys-tRNA(Pro) deacylase)